MTNELEGRRRSRERDNDRLHVRPEGLNHKKSSIFPGSRKIAKKQGKFRWVIKESSVAGLAGMTECFRARLIIADRLFLHMDLCTFTARPMLASFPGLPRGGGERKAWYTLHAHAR